nr:MAG TPA: hypothetical protein [Caudoviricetes sp.]
MERAGGSIDRAWRPGAPHHHRVACHGPQHVG